MLTAWKNTYVTLQRYGDNRNYGIKELNHVSDLTRLDCLIELIG